MCLIDRCRRCNVSQVDHTLLHRALQIHVRPTGSPGKHLETPERRSPAMQCSETESLHESHSSTMFHTHSLLQILPTIVSLLLQDSNQTFCKIYFLALIGYFLDSIAEIASNSGLLLVCYTQSTVLSLSVCWSHS